MHVLIISKKTPQYLNEDSGSPCFLIASVYVDKYLPTSISVCDKINTETKPGTSDTDTEYNKI